MNNRSSIAWIGVFLAVFWVIGLMFSSDRNRVDEAYVLPSLQAAKNVAIDSVVVERPGQGKGAEYRFERKDGNWTLSQGKQSIKVEGARLNELVREVRDAKRDGEVNLTGSLSSYGLQPPQTTVILSGKARKKQEAITILDEIPKDEPKDEPVGAEKTWKLFLGNSSPDKRFVYVSTSETPDRAFAVLHDKLKGAMFKSVNDLRSKRLFEFAEPVVQSVSLAEGTKELEAKKLKNGAWLLTMPNLGYANFEGTPAAKEPLAKPKTTVDGIKPLLAAIAAVRVDSDDDFVTPADDLLSRTGLAAGSEALRIGVTTGEGKNTSEETLLVGKADGDFYYARMAKDDGVFKLRQSSLEAIFAAVKSPAELRNRDLAPISIKECDAITLTQGKDEARFVLGGDPRAWFVSLGTSPQTRANNTIVEFLIGALQGRRDVVAFKEVNDAEAAKVDQELGFNQPQAVASVYLQGVDEGKSPKLKTDAKPAATWAFGKTEENRVWVKRTMPDGPAARFAIDKSALEKIVPREGLIGFAELVLPRLQVRDIVRMQLDRGDKSVVLEHKNDRWVLKDAAGESPADTKKVEEFARKFTDASVRRWVRKIDAKDDLEQYGLKTPGLKLTLTLKQDGLTAATLASALGQLGSAMSDPTLQAIGAAWGNLQLGGEKVVIKFGKEATEKDDTGNVFVQHSKTDRLSVAPVALANALRDAEFRDRMIVLMPEVQVAAAMIGAPALDSVGGWLTASPLSTLQLGNADAAKVRDIRITVRTPYELRTFTFSRKDKNWVDQSGLKEFQVDDDHVSEVANLMSRLDFNRVVQLEGGPKADQKLTAKNATVVIDAIMGDLRPVNLTIGANFEGHGYYVHSSNWSGAVFLLRADRVQPMLGGVGYFAKERTTN